VVEWVARISFLCSGGCFVVVAQGSNPKFFFFCAGKLFLALLFLNFRKAAQEKFYMRMVSET